MGASRVMLFAPPLAPLPLEPAGEVILGRSNDCDLPIHSSEASRLHAAVRAEGGRYFIRDLGSTNGTSLNGIALETESVLSAGDRIGVGGAVVTFCQVDDAVASMLPDPAEEAQTVLAETPPAQRVDHVRGDLRAIPAFALVQMLELGARSGVLIIRGPVCSGKLWIEAGHPVDAETETQRGFEAAIEMVSASQGEFDFGPGAPRDERTIEASLTELVLEASCRMDRVA
jgi:pSer/pThr/pTyr-binding forkhead associated (FHA) protein